MTTYISASYNTLKEGYLTLHKRTDFPKALQHDSIDWKITTLVKFILSLVLIIPFGCKDCAFFVWNKIHRNPKHPPTTPLKETFNNLGNEILFNSISSTNEVADTFQTDGSSNNQDENNLQISQKTIDSPNNIQNSEEQDHYRITSFFLRIFTFGYYGSNSPHAHIVS